MLKILSSFSSTRLYHNNTGSRNRFMEYYVPLVAPSPSQSTTLRNSKRISTDAFGEALSKVCEYFSVLLILVFSLLFPLAHSLHSSSLANFAKPQRWKTHCSEASFAFLCLWSRLFGSKEDATAKSRDRPLIVSFWTRCLTMRLSGMRVVSFFFLLLSCFLILLGAWSCFFF